MIATRGSRHAVERAITAFAVVGFAAAWLLPVSVAWKLAPDLGHAWAVPLLMGYLWWERWGERPAVVARPPLAMAWMAAVIFGIVQLPLRLLLTPFPLWPALLGVYTLLFAAIALFAGWLVAGRPGVRWVGGPLVLLLSVLPVPSLAEASIIMPLRVAMASLAAEISNLVAHPALAMGTSVRLGGGWVGIDEACGGIRSLQACTMIGLFFGEWYRFRWGRRIALVGAGLGAALLGNFGRVLFLSLRAGSGIAAVESAHNAAGWVAMGVSLVLTGWLACRWGGYRWPEQTRPAPDPDAPATAAFAQGRRWLALVVVLFAVNESATRGWYARGEARRRTLAQWTAALPEHDPSFQVQPLPDVAREMLRPDHFAAGRWRAAPDLFVNGYYIEWHRGQIARSVPFLHNPTVCLPLAGCELVQTLAPIVVQWSGGEIPFFAYKFRRTGEEILVAFTIWDSSRSRPLVRPAEIKSWRQWWDGQWAEVREGRQHQPAQLLTLTVPWSDHADRLAQATLGNLIQPLPAN